LLRAAPAQFDGLPRYPVMRRVVAGRTEPPKARVDPVDGLLRDQAALALVVKGDLGEYLVHIHEFLTRQKKAGDPAALQSGGVHQPVRRRSQVLHVRGGLA